MHDGHALETTEPTARRRIAAQALSPDTISIALLLLAFLLMAVG
jgi:hypothetical protein